MTRFLGRSALRVLHAAFFWGGLVDLVGADPVEVVLIPAVLAVGVLAGIIVVVMEGSMEGESCGQCRYWMEMDDGPDGWCRRHPPQVVVEPDYVSGPGSDAWTTETVWPETSSNAWCGEFAPVAASVAAP